MGGLGPRRPAPPPAYRPDPAIGREAVRLGARHGATLRWDADPHRAVREADVVYTDVWVSMGQERQRAQRLKAFTRYQVNASLLKMAPRGCRIMHCLHAHRGEEITEQVMDSKHSLIFTQAENRLHAQKALLMMLLGRKPAS